LCAAELAVKAEKTAVIEAQGSGSSQTNAYALLKDLKEDALATAVFRGMQKEHQEVLLAQAHLAQTGGEGSHGHGGYGGRHGYDDDFGYGHRFRETYRGDGDAGGSEKRNAEVLMTSTAMTPPLLVPKYIEIEVYVVKMQDSYYPLGE
jgi:hypothetical protein